MQESARAPLSLSSLGFIEPKVLSKAIKVTTATLTNWRCAGKGPPFTRVHGNKIVYPLEGVKKWLADRTVKPTLPPTLINPRKVARRSTPPQAGGRVPSST